MNTNYDTQKILLGLKQDIAAAGDELERATTVERQTIIASRIRWLREKIKFYTTGMHRMYNATNGDKQS